jgi:hypothetical protein
MKRSGEVAAKSLEASWCIKAVGLRTALAKLLRRDFKALTLRVGLFARHGGVVQNLAPLAYLFARRQLPERRAP